MGECQVKRGATAPIQSPQRTGKQEREQRKSQYLRPNQFDSDGRRFRNSRSHHKPVRSHRPSVDAGSMASTENEPQTSNTSMSDGQEQPPENDGALEQNKLSSTEPFRSPYDLDDNSTTPNLPAQPTTPRPILNEDSGHTTPNLIHPGSLEGRDRPSPGVSRLPQPTTDRHVPSRILQYNTAATGPLHYAPSPEHTSETGGAIEEIAGKAKLTSSHIPAAELPSNEDLDIISTEDTNPTKDDCNKGLGLDWLCIQDPKEGEYMTLIPFQLSSVEPPKVFIKPSKTEVQRVAQLRLDVRRRRLEIQNLKLLLQAKDKQIFDENEETFKRLREFVTEPHRRPKIHDSSLELALRLFFASQLSRDECGPLNDEISSLEESLAFEEVKLTQAEDSLYNSFGIPPMESEEGRGNGVAMPGLPIPHSPPTSESEHRSANHIDEAEGEDDESDDDPYSTGSFEKYRKIYHPLYIEYQENRGAQENLYERRAYFLEDLARLEDQQQSRHRVGLSLLQDDQDFLDSLPEAIHLLDVEIDEYGLAIEGLRAECLEQGIIDEDDNYIEGDSENPDDSAPLPPPPLLAPPVPPTPEPIPPPSPPPMVITPNPPPSPPATTFRPSVSSLISSNYGARLDDQSYQNRINPWLLGKLTASRTELALLATILSAMDAEPDVASLLDVLRMWDHDGAGMEPPKRPEKLDEAMLNRVRHVTRKVVGDGFDRALVRSLFGLSSWDGGAHAGIDESAYLDDI
ncbi:hypothetical protein V500_11314 [Pseudogymnoascus sp. VKM F-4518 (FW-2643)]|nr:hypothetical protein V500_11314 [Pseudogymnoascus sp. VKM F-4518 (FW-2643)]